LKTLCVQGRSQWGRFCACQVPRGSTDRRQAVKQSRKGCSSGIKKGKERGGRAGETCGRSTIGMQGLEKYLYRNGRREFPRAHKTNHRSDAVRGQKGASAQGSGGAKAIARKQRLLLDGKGTLRRDLGGRTVLLRRGGETSTGKAFCRKGRMVVIGPNRKSILQLVQLDRISASLEKLGNGRAKRQNSRRKSRQKPRQKKSEVIGASGRDLEQWKISAS